jgi:hypothetical protein
MAKGNKFVHIVTGKEFEGDLPKEVTTIVSETVETGATISRLITAKVGDKDYDKVLESIMFAGGWIRKKPGIKVNIGSKKG